MPLFEKDACWDALWRCKQLHRTIALLPIALYCHQWLFVLLRAAGRAVPHDRLKFVFWESHARYNLHVICSCSVRHEDNEFEPEGLGIAVPGSWHRCGCGGADYIWHWALHCISWMSLLSFCQVASPLQAMMSNPSSSWRPLQMSKRLSGRLDSINFLFLWCTCCKSRCTEVHLLFSWHNQTLSSHSLVFNSILIEYLNRICYILALFLVTLRSSSF